MLLRLDPDDLRDVARLLDRAADDLAALARAGRVDVALVDGGLVDGAAPGAAVRVGGPGREVAARLHAVGSWAAQAAAVLRERARAADADERLTSPAALLTPSRAVAVPAAAPTGGPPGRPPAAVGSAGPLAALRAALAAAPPDPAGRASGVAEHLRTVPPAQRAALVAADPVLVGGLDGAPEEMRYAANGVVLRRALAAEESRLAALTAAERAGPQGAVGRRRVAGLTALLAPRRGVDGRPVPRQWLLVDPTGRGRGVEVVGATAATARLDAARAVAVVVPGMGSRLLPPPPTATDAAGRLAAEAARLTGPGTVVVAWQGYDAPAGLDVLSPASAAAGGRGLDGFVRGLAAATPAPVSLLGHSYGSLVVAAAVRTGPGPLPVQAVAVYGSPGLGPGVRGAADLGLAPGVPVLALAAPGDWVAWSGWHGDSPVEADWGSERLDTRGATGHTAYLEPGTTALAALALVAGGRAPCAQRTPPAPDGGPASAALADLRTLADGAPRGRATPVGPVGPGGPGAC